VSRIIRVSKRANYSTIDNHFVNDEGLSWQATGLLTYLLSKPDHWSVSVVDLVKRKTNGRAAVQKVLSELEDAGYLDRVKGRGERGRFVYESTVHEQPNLNINGDSSECDHSRFTSHGPPQTVNQPVVNTEVVKTEKKKREPKPNLPETPAEWPEPLKAAWGQFVAYRRERRQPLTPTGAGRLMAKLSAWGPNKAVAALNASVENGWQGVFEPKQQPSSSAKSFSLPTPKAAGDGGKLVTPNKQIVRVYE
jgi:DNA-binding MarR family transcriptional regulator